MLVKQERMNELEKNVLNFENHRQIRILQLLIESNLPLSADSISSNLNVSPRLIRYDMSFLKSMLENNMIHIQSIRGKGYFLVDKVQASKGMKGISSQNSFLYDKLGAYDSYLREQLILRNLLLSADIVTYQELMECFFISRSTLTKDLIRAQETIGPYNLILNQIPYHGIKIIGSELHKRMMLGRELAFYKSHDLLSYIHEELKICDISVVQLADLIENKFEYKISHIGLFNVYVHLSIMLLRIHQNQIIEDSDLTLDVSFTGEKLEILKIFFDVYCKGHTIPKVELCYFLVLIKSNCYKVSIPEKEQDKYLMLNTCALNEMKNDVKYEFYQSELLEYLSELLYSQEVRILNNVVNNPLLIRAIKKYSSISLELAYRYAKKIKELTGLIFLGNDICNISHYFYNYSEGKSLHYKWRILIVGAHGELLEKRFIQQVRKTFERVQITYVEIHKINETKISKYDMIIANVTTDSDFSNIPFIQVNYFLDSKNIFKITELKNEIIMNKFIKAMSLVEEVQIETWRGVLSWYCMNQTLLDPNQFLETLVERNETLTYEVRKKFAIICLFENKLLKSKILYFKKGIKWKSAVIHYAIFINVLATNPLTYYEWEEFIDQFDDIIFRVNESKC